MDKITVSHVIQNAAPASRIIFKTGKGIFRTWIQTSRKIAGMYKQAGTDMFNEGKGLIKDTVKVTVKSQKEILESSGEAFKDILRIMKEDGTQKIKSKSRKKDQRKDTRENVTIDDMLS